MAFTFRWESMDSVPRDGGAPCLSDGTALVAGAWDGTGWLPFPDEARDSVDPPGIVPRRWMRATSRRACHAACRTTWASECKTRREDLTCRAAWRPPNRPGRVSRGAAPVRAGRR